MSITSTEADGIVTITMDDGAKNGMDTTTFQGLIAAFKAAEDAKAVVLSGREGIFSAGLNLKVLITLDRAGMQDLLVQFGQALAAVWMHPTPVVVAATGHAVAAGTMFAMAADHTVAAEGEYFWGLTETQIDFPMPMFGIILSRANVAADRLDDLLLPGLKVDAATAVEVGYADEAVPAGEVLARAQEKAAELGKLPIAAYRSTKKRLRGAAAHDLLSNLEADISAVLDDKGV